MSMKKFASRIDAVDRAEALSAIRFTVEPLPDGAAPALELLDEPGREDGRVAHSTKISTRSSSSAMSTIFPG